MQPQHHSNFHMLTLACPGIFLALAGHSLQPPSITITTTTITSTRISSSSIKDLLDKVEMMRSFKIDSQINKQLDSQIEDIDSFLLIYRKQNHHSFPFYRENHKVLRKSFLRLRTKKKILSLRIWRVCGWMKMAVLFDFNFVFVHIFHKKL